MTWVAEEREAKGHAGSLSSTPKDRLSIMRDELAKVRQGIQGGRNFGSADASDDSKTLSGAFNNLMDELSLQWLSFCPQLEKPFRGLRSIHPNLELLHALVVPFAPGLDNIICDLLHQLYADISH